MDNFVVSARKYRPQNFSTVVGQSHITTTLKNAIKNNQLAHAFLFCGPRGVGKTTCARILAKTINCENQTADGEACNVCNSCVSFDAGASLNIHELDAASNNSVDDIRTLVEQVRFAPQAGKYKVYIVDEVHMLSSSAFNAFLKTLEEPPPFAIFILATTEKHKILPTILSRCQIFDFKRITNNDTVEHLQEICVKEHITADKAALHIIAQKSEGCMRDSLSILDKIVSFTNGEVNYQNTLEHLNILDEDYYFKLLAYLLSQDISSALLMFDEINRKGFEGDTVINGFAEFLRNLLVSKDARVAMLLEVAEDFKQKYIQQSEKTPVSFIVSALNILNEAEINFKQSRNKRLHVELTLIKLSFLQQAIELTGNDGAFSKKKIVEGSKTIAFRALPPIRKQTNVAETKAPTKPVVPSATLIIETTATKKAEVILPKDESTASSFVLPTTENKPSLSSLKNIKETIAAKRKLTEINPISLSIDLVNEAWEKYIDILKERSNHSAVTNFKTVELSIINNDLIDIITGSPIQKSFIEVERAGLVDHLQQFFRNKALVYQITVIEIDLPEEEPETLLSKKQQYQMMIENYPLVKQLRDRLKLDLE
ncbi:MAG: DNA polymerase III subunit gamma/tau [Ferruginibacter sp.]